MYVFLVVKVFPPVKLTVDGLNVSWSRGSQYNNGHEFELQFRSVEQSWTVRCFSLSFSVHTLLLIIGRCENLKTCVCVCVCAQDVESTRVTELHVELQEDSLILDQLYVLRVRAKLIDESTAVWSDWSTEYNWTSKVGKPRPPSGESQ